MEGRTTASFRCPCSDAAATGASGSLPEAFRGPFATSHAKLINSEQGSPQALPAQPRKNDGLEQPHRSTGTESLPLCGPP